MSLYKFLVLQIYDNNAVLLNQQCRFNFPHHLVLLWLYFIHMFQLLWLRSISMCLRRQNLWTKTMILIWKEFCCSMKEIWESQGSHSHQLDDECQILIHKLHFFVCTIVVWFFYLQWFSDQGTLLHCQFNCQMGDFFEFQFGFKSFSKTILYKNSTELFFKKYNISRFIFNKIHD